MPSPVDSDAANHERRSSAQAITRGILNTVNDMADSPGNFRIPGALSVTQTLPRRTLVIASCFGGQFPGYLHAAGCECDYLLFNHVRELPVSPPQPIANYDFQIVQLAIRSVLPELAYFRTIESEAAAETLFEEAEQRLFQHLAAAMRWNSEHGLLTFVCNFMVPQQNPMGRLLSRHDKRNLVRFFHRLNDSLSTELARYKNAYVLDCDEVSASLGRRYIQDDVFAQSNHGSVLDRYDALDVDRLHPPRSLAELYPDQRAAYMTALVEECFAMHRTVQRIDAVKLVIVDLDDTLWRGVVADNFQGAGAATEGYPLGFVEALLYLKARGIVLAIVSKNDADKITRAWQHVWHGKLLMEDFAVRKINWQPKELNVEAVMREVNVLPGSVVFIDDNPVERAAVQAAFPEIRVLGDEPFILRQILLWSTETQVPFITEESARRTAMIHSQVEREASRSRLSREDFLASLNVRTTIFAIDSVDDPKFQRAFELINKTNQFNTSGRRLAMNACSTAFAQGMVFHAFEVEDVYTHYGLVGVAIVRSHCIEQFVMSCRVIGLGVETDAVERISRTLHDGGAHEVMALFKDTGANHLCRDLFERSGFTLHNDIWIHAETAPSEQPDTEQAH
jgi:FkbH-like protein